MLNSYRVAILLMILFGVAGIQAARYQDEAPSAACKRPLPAEGGLAKAHDAMPQAGTPMVSAVPIGAGPGAALNKIAVNAPAR